MKDAGGDRDGRAASALAAACVGLALLSAACGGKSAAEQIQPGMFVVAVTVLFLPILDVLSAIIRRLREGRAIHHPDKEHLHHKLMHLGLNARQIDLVIYAASALLAAAGVLAYSATDATGAVIILVGWLVGIALFLTLHYLRRNPKT